MFLRSILDLYSLKLPAVLVSRLRGCRYSGWRLFYWFWHTKRFQTEDELTEAERSVSVLLGLAMLGQILLGAWLIADWVRFGSAGDWEFGVALLLSYPIFWTHLIVFCAWIYNVVWFILHPKQAARSFVCTVLEIQVRQLRSRRNFKVVAVVGSVGKTSTKLAAASLLEKTMRVRYQTGNYNDRVTVPLVFFGLTEPSLYNIVAWFKVFGATQSEIALPYPYDVVVVELGTDEPGMIEQFAYIKPDITVVTAISEEHMENFDSLDKVAAEELKVFSYSKKVLVNADDIAGKYLAGREFTEYSLVSNEAQYFATAKPKGLKGQELEVRLPNGECKTDIHFNGKQGAKFTLAAAAVADQLGVKVEDIASGLTELLPFSGRMQILEGIKGSTIIDDTYNASPLADFAALDTLYAVRTEQRVAILGSMNELGDYSRQAHEAVGGYCDPGKLDVVVTIGHDARQWLAPAARERGCTVHTCNNPYEAGDYVLSKLKKGGVVLAKGSQNHIFAEESLKVLLADPTDAAKLVRQSQYWMTKKQKQFKR